MKAATRFQFLLVRLREVYKNASDTVKEISIPSGAIKSVGLTVTVRFSSISIPSGAIKSLIERFFQVIDDFDFNSFWCD
jgi:hypothetical protein